MLAPPKTFAGTHPPKNCCFATKVINCDVTSRLLSISTCYSRRPGSLRAGAFRGHGFSLLEKTTLRGLQTRAIPAGVTALHLPGLIRLTEKNLLLANAIPATRIHEDSLKKKTAFSACDVSQRSFPCPAGGKASVGPRSALARGGPPAARGKRSVYGVRLPK